MIQVYDIALDNNNDLQIANGDFVIGESTEQHQTLLLLSDKNDWKESPTVGVGIESFLDDEEPADMHREIRLQFAKDGMKVKKIQTVRGQIQIEAGYEEN